MRIIGGALRGRRFIAPEEGVRPTSDRVREAIFSALQSRGLLSEARVLDAFCGSGAFAFESISRGAQRATLVDNSPAVLKALRKNIAELDLHAKVDVRKVDLFSKAQKAFHKTDIFDLVFIDPPYARVSELEPVFEALRPHAENACIVLEQDRRAPFVGLEQLGLIVDREAHYGGTLVQFLSFSEQPIV